MKCERIASVDLADIGDVININHVNATESLRSLPSQPDVVETKGHIEVEIGDSAMLVTSLWALGDRVVSASGFLFPVVVK